MGQAKRRGTFEERKAFAVSRIEEEHRKRLEWETSPEAKTAIKKRIDTRLAMAQLMAMWFGTSAIPRYPFIR